MQKLVNFIEQTNSLRIEIATNKENILDNIGYEDGADFFELIRHELENGWEIHIARQCRPSILSTVTISHDNWQTWSLPSQFTTALAKD